MDNDRNDGEVARRSMRIYLPLSIGAAVLFFLASGGSSDAGSVARLGGALWVGLLTLIVSMPIVVARTKARSRRGASRVEKKP